MKAPLHVRVAVRLGAALDSRLQRHDSWAAAPWHLRKADAFVGWLYCLWEKP